MDEKPDDILDLFLPFQIKLRSRIWLLPNTDAHGQPFREAEYVFIRLIVTDKKQTGLSEMDHEGQCSLSFPTLSRWKDIHRKFAEDYAGRRR